jgi:hypothetical protein
MPTLLSLLVRKIAVESTVFWQDTFSENSDWGWEIYEGNTQIGTYPDFPVADVFNRTRISATERLVIEYLYLGHEFCRVGIAYPTSTFKLK